MHDGTLGGVLDSLGLGVRERTREDAEKQLAEAERGKVKINYIPPALYKVPKKTDPLTPSFTREKDSSGVDVLTVQRLLGHRSVSTTMRYFHLSQAHMAVVRSPLDLLDVDRP